MICKKCGRIIPDGEEHNINAGTDRAYHVCEICFESMWDADDITKCNGCGEWYEYDIPKNIGQFGGDSFVPCPSCGRDIVDGMDIAERLAEDDNFTQCEKLYLLIIRTAGNPSCKQMETIGYSFESFLRLSDSKLSKEQLVHSARQRLKENGIYAR